MPEFLEFTYEKFTIRVAGDCLYSDEGLWVKLEGGKARVGLSDFIQQRNGDVAFVEVKPVGEVLRAGEELAVVETIKVDISLGMPVSGKLLEENPVLEITPETINQDPYGAGWLALIEPSDWQGELAQLMEPQVYFERMKLQVAREME
jgi:glycine cleavage system H protein